MTDNVKPRNIHLATQPLSTITTTASTPHPFLPSDSNSESNTPTSGEELKCHRGGNRPERDARETSYECVEHASYDKAKGVSCAELVATFGEIEP
ncbi:hypothetical protein BaRGS_00019359 [Batillaria attramentaria]|uniref:Uncharacterized protein n=1 Tax=Batillaria attramentaria TaxID=370345 RepID=A0ABD0KRN5_9CAEN